MIKKVLNKKELSQWVKYSIKLYPEESLYVPPIYRVFEKELRNKVLKKNEYIALLCYKNDLIVGRVMYTFTISKKTKMKTCYFSYYDSINNYSITKELFDYVVKDMKKNLCTILEGAYTPYDPDNRRGILVEGFNISPMIFTSYNMDYYNSLLESYGLNKAYDTLSLSVDFLANNDKLKKLNDYVLNKNTSFHVEYLDFKKIKRQIQDIQIIMEKSTNEINYTMAPDIKMIKSFIKEYRFFINPDFITIMYSDSNPIGFCATLPNFNQLFKKLNGKLNIFKVLKHIRKIDSARGFLQYVIPEYQTRGAIICMYYASILSLIKHNITTFEASTILEDNIKSHKIISNFNGVISKRYRIYRKVI